MSVLRRIMAWLGWRLHAVPRPKEQDHWPGLLADSIVGRRLRQLADVDWNGRATLLRIGELEGALRVSMHELTRVELAGRAIAPRAAEHRLAIEDTLEPYARFAELVSGWPGNWSQSEWRFIAIEGDLRTLGKDARQTIEAAREADLCTRSFETLRARYEGDQRRLWQRISNELDLRRLLESLESPAAVRSMSHRLSLAKSVLEESDTLLKRSLDDMVEAMSQAGYDAYAPEYPSLETEVSRLREWIPHQCEARIKASGHRVSQSCTTQLGRLIQPSDRKLRAGVRESLQMEPLGPLLYWARLHHSTQPPAQPNRARKRGKERR
jgi:hypothetical protein